MAVFDAVSPFFRFLEGKLGLERFATSVPLAVSDSYKGLTMRANRIPALTFMVMLALITGACAGDGEAESANSRPVKKVSMKAEWKVEAEYPDFDFPNIDNHIKAWLTAHIHSLMDNYKDVADADDPETSLTVNITYCIATDSPEVVGLLFLTVMDLNLAAHPTASYSSLNFSANGEFLSLDSLFADPDRALEIFAEQAPKLLPAAFPDREDELEGLDDWIATGTAPNLDNYSCYIVEPDGLRIHFQQYQVVPYYLGMPDVLIPLSALEPAGPNAEVWPAR